MEIIIDGGIMIDYVYGKDINVRVLMILIYYSYYEVFELIILWVFYLIFIFSVRFIKIKWL